MARTCTKMWRTDGKVGCVVRKKIKSGLTVCVYHAEQAGYEFLGPWLLVCEDHNIAVERIGQRECRNTVSRPSSWCPICNEENPNGIQFTDASGKCGPIAPPLPPPEGLITNPAVVAINNKKPVSGHVLPSNKPRSIGANLLDCRHYSWWEKDGVCEACVKRHPRINVNNKRPLTDVRCQQAYRIID